MIRAKYNYWTLNHVLISGLIDHEDNRFQEFTTIAEFKTFYINTFRKQSRSKYEKEFIDIYFNYLESLTDEEALSTPLLIPEYRFGDIQKKKSKRIDFVILNSYTMNFTGFELSPQSSHLPVQGIKTKKLVELNDDIKKSWMNEVQKRNMFQDEHDLRIYTLADEHLKDINRFFKDFVIPCLSRESQTCAPPETILEEIRKID
jgi:hypothetical protein